MLRPLRGICRLAGGLIGPSRRAVEVSSTILEWWAGAEGVEGKADHYRDLAEAAREDGNPNLARVYGRKAGGYSGQTGARARRGKDGRFAK